MAAAERCPTCGGDLKNWSPWTMSADRNDLPGSPRMALLFQRFRACEFCTRTDYQWRTCILPAYETTLTAYADNPPPVGEVIDETA